MSEITNARYRAKLVPNQAAVCDVKHPDGSRCNAAADAWIRIKGKTYWVCPEHRRRTDFLLMPVSKTVN